MIHIPQIHFDWTVNPTNLLAVLFFMFTSFMSYQQFKSDVQTNKAITDERFSEVATKLADQDKKIDSVAADLKATLNQNTMDIKSDIRELRTNVMDQKQHR